jgi:F-type H+-transporting ATPase subunit a
MDSSVAPGGASKNHPLPPPRRGKKKEGFPLEEVFEKLDRIIVFQVNLGGITLDISNSLLVSWIVSGILVVLAFLATRRLQANPGKLQNALELLVETVNSMCESSIGASHWRPFAPYILGLILYLFMCNTVALINFFPFVKFYPPTKDINVTGALALMSLILILYASFRYKGVKGWLRSLIDPLPVVAPFKILEYVTKPVSLCLRLFGNILAGFVIMELVFMAIPYVSEPFSLYFDIFDGILHAFVFAYLTTLYIGEAVE